MPVTTRSYNGRGRGGNRPNRPIKPIAEEMALPRWPGVATPVYGIDECGPGAISKETPKSPLSGQHADIPPCPPRPKKIAPARARVPLKVLVSAGYALIIYWLLSVGNKYLFINDKNIFIYHSSGTF